MNLGDVMSGSGLVGFAEAGLAVSFLTFVAIALWAARRPRAQMEALARAALENEVAPGSEADR